VLASELYTTAGGARRGVTAARCLAQVASRHEIRAAVDGRFYFVVKGWNGEVVGRSELYASRSNAERGSRTVVDLLSAERVPGNDLPRPPARTSCGLPDAYADFFESSDWQVVSERTLRSAQDEATALEKEQIVEAMKSTSGANGFAEVFERVDGGLVNLTTLRSAGQTYIAVEYGAGDNSFGAIHPSSPLRRAQGTSVTARMESFRYLGRPPVTRRGLKCARAPADQEVSHMSFASVVRAVPAFALLSVVACSASTSSEEPAPVTGDDEVVSARLACVVKGDPCQHGSAGDLEACVDAVVLRQATGGKVRLDVTRRSTVGDPQGSKPLRLTSDQPSSLAANTIDAQWDGGEHWVRLAKKGAKYEGELTLDQDFSFQISCTSAGTANAGCQYGGPSCGRRGRRGRPDDARRPRR
jgi:uncharacterized protein YegP (UPF0339 family)